MQFYSYYNAIYSLQIPVCRLKYLYSQPVFPKYNKKENLSLNNLINERIC
jgi:hypothetical protein